MPKFLAPIDLSKNELRNAVIQNLATAPASPVKGQLYFDTATNKLYYHNGSGWIDTSGSALVSSVSGTAPIVVTGTTTPTISINAATGSSPGSMSAADKTKLDAATAANTASTLVLRDGSNNFAAGTITATLTGNASSAAIASALTPGANIAGVNAWSSILYTTTNQNWQVGCNGGNGAGAAFEFRPASSDTGKVTITTAGTVTAPQLSSTVGTGTAPLVVASTTQVSNLNADSTDGFHATTANTLNTIAARDASCNIAATTFTGALAGNASTATKLATARTIGITSDISGSGSFDGSGDLSFAATLPNIVTAGTNPKITYNAKGQVTGGAALASGDVTTALGYTPVNLTALGAASGIATLDASSHLTSSQLTSGLVTGALGFTPVNNTLVGAASGLATLDAGGKVPTSQLPASVLGAMQYQGTWNASTNASPALASGVGTKGYYYKVSVAGTTLIDGNSTWRVGDIICFDGSVWDYVDGSANDIVSVCGKTGVVTLANTDITGFGTMSTQGSGAVAITGGTMAGVAITGGTVGSLTTDLAVADGGTGASTLTGYVKGAGTSALTGVSSIPNTDISGLGTMSTQGAGAVNISGGTISGITDLAVADGGTGSSTAAGARSNLGATGKYAVDVGDGVATSYTITHNLSTSDVHVSVYTKASTFDVVYPDIQITTTNTITLIFAVAPTSAQYRCVVIG